VIDCPECKASGIVVHVLSERGYESPDGIWEPDEEEYTCPTCEGMGEILAEGVDGQSSS